MNKDYTEISFNFPNQNTFYFNIVVQRISKDMVFVQH